jgi:hypothetical protein
VSADGDGEGVSRLGELVSGGDAAVEGAGAFGGLGRVLSDVGGDPPRLAETGDSDRILAVHGR